MLGSSIGLLTGMGGMQNNQYDMAAAADIDNRTQQDQKDSHMTAGIITPYQLELQQQVDEKRRRAEQEKYQQAQMDHDLAMKVEREVRARNKHNKDQLEILETWPGSKQ